jgi:F-type H+-transporting ATPase subunit a
MGTVVLVTGLLLALLWARKTGKLLHWIVAGVTFVMGLLGLLESLKILTEVPIFTYGIPAVLSVYFDFFSGFIQALVFTLLSMVYIGGSLPAPAEEAAE